MQLTKLRAKFCEEISQQTGLSVKEAESALNAAMADMAEYHGSYDPLRFYQEGSIKKNSNVEFFYESSGGSKPRWLIAGPKSNHMDGTVLLDPQMVEKIEDEDYYYEMFSEF